MNKLNKRKLQVTKVNFDFKDYAFPKQYEVFRSGSTRFRTIVTSRRFGKSNGIAGDMLDTCSKEANVTCLYITLTRENIRKIIWGDLKRIVEEYGINCIIDNSHLEIKFPNGSRILTGGAKDATECKKFRGLKLKKVYIDEAQSFRAHLRDLINDILIPALRDLRGELFLVGTPGPVAAGVFYEYSHSSEWLNFTDL